MEPEPFEIIGIETSAVLLFKYFRNRYLIVGTKGCFHINSFVRFDLLFFISYIQIISEKVKMYIKKKKKENVDIFIF